MADIKISELGAASTVNNADLIPMTSAGVTVKATAQQFKNYMGVGNLADLTTDAKASAVAAINEVNTKASKTEVLISNIQDGLAIVENGDTCTHTGGISKGQYVCWKGVLYTADADIAVGTTFASSGGGKNLTVVVDGGLNDLRNEDILIAKSNSSNTSWASKLGALQSAYNGLSTYQKRHAFLLISDVVCPCYDSGLFGRIAFSQNNPAFSWFDIVNQKYIRVLFNSNNTSSYNDYSDSTSSTDIYLYAPKR